MNLRNNMFDSMSRVYDYKISTMTISASYGPNISFNLTNIGKYLDIDVSSDTTCILGIKYDFGNTSILKGKYTTSVYKKSKNKNTEKINVKLFYNQVSIIVKVNENIVNVKLFANGSLHLTGIKDLKEVKIIMDFLYQKLSDLKLKNDMILLTKDSNGVYLDNNNMVYSSSEPRYIIGYKDKDTYVINKKSYTIDFYTKCFISTKIEAKRTRSIYDFDGNYIGFSKIELLKNKLKLYKKNSNINFDPKIVEDKNPFSLIYYDGDNYSSIIGKVVYYTGQLQSTQPSLCAASVLECLYSCNPFKDDNEINYIIDTNCINIYFNIQMEINRQRLFSKLLEYKYVAEYKPEKYSGVKLLYKLNFNLQQRGMCSCSIKCTCNNITFLIFQTGNIIVTGFKNVNEINPILNDFKVILDNMKDNIKKRIL
jgi:TATA-box binding protein (TBP) (component of TFIID and TFIIIB)